MPPAYSNNNDESSTITPIDSASSISVLLASKTNLNARGSSKTYINQKDIDNKKLMYSKSDLETKKKNVRKKIEQMMKCKL